MTVTWSMHTQPLQQHVCCTSQSCCDWSCCPWCSSCWSPHCCELAWSGILRQEETHLPVDCHPLLRHLQTVSQQHSSCSASSVYQSWAATLAMPRSWSWLVGTVTSCQGSGLHCTDQNYTRDCLLHCCAWRHSGNHICCLRHVTFSCQTAKITLYICQVIDDYLSEHLPLVVEVVVAVVVYMEEGGCSQHAPACC